MRVLVTRSPGDAERTARKLAALGHAPVVAPVTRIVPTDEPQPVEGWDALVVTSAHARDALALLPDKAPQVFAVGPHTAAAVREAGFADVVAAEGDARSLSGLIRGSLPGGRTLLHVTGRHHKEEPAASLAAAGFRVLAWKAYEAQRVEVLPPSAIGALRTGQIDAALHYSRRSADIVLRLAEEAGLTPTLRTFPHLCLSADVAASFQGLGMATLAAARPDEEALLALLKGLP
ncbi:uroporphyrinogen-III synthase [Microvirga lenta]|uniref:uroporphyrinogen-III synthase n=1 Tax=Microvirga lenta TaxID=2881337 RepID=UPI001CFCBB16|nr:uroporphyrinogen-III synthase [Microvirga lenta]MCB5174550.1 uroporphyrinogen-III synthase [Microvirga lenta]